MGYKNQKQKNAFIRRIKTIQESQYSYVDKVKREQEKTKRETNLGPRMTIINAYLKNNDINDAYEMAKEMNKKLNKEVFSNEQVDFWISEYNKTIEAR